MFLVVALLVIGFFVYFRVGHGYPPVRHRWLGRGDAAFLSAAAESFFPPDARLPLDGGAADLPGYADRYLAALPIRQRRLIRLLLLLFEQATLIFPARGLGAFRRFSAMAPEQRRSYLDGWARSRLVVRRMAFDALKALLVMGYLGREENLRALGLAPWEIEPVVCGADHLYPPIGAPRSAVRRRPADADVERPGSPLRAGGAPAP